MKNRDHELPPLESLTLSETPGRLNLLLAPHATLTFDAADRPLALHEGGVLTARGLDGRCLQKSWAPNGDRPAQRRVRVLSAGDGGRFRRRIGLWLDRARQSALDLSHRGAWSHRIGGQLQHSPLSFLLHRLDRLAAWTRDRWTSDAGRARRLWPAIGILPPDQYLAFVVPVVDGCPWNRCAFCDFYVGQTFRVRTPADIRRQVSGAVRFFGPALAGRCSIFLAGANVFQAPPSLLMPLAEELAERFPQLARPQADGMGGLYGFAEATRLSAWSDRDLHRLARSGFRRAYMGIETGHGDLRRSIRKPGSADDVWRAADRLKNAGIQRGVIVLLGVGGREGNRSHGEGTASLLSRLSLGPGDIVYFSPLVRGAGYHRLAQRQGWTPLSPDAMADQRRDIEHRFPANGETRALYDIREFLY